MQINRNNEIKKRNKDQIYTIIEREKKFKKKEDKFKL
jgi:hypothetical protein